MDKKEHQENKTQVSPLGFGGPHLSFLFLLDVMHQAGKWTRLVHLMLCCSWYCSTSSCVAVLDLVTVNGTYVLRNLTKALPFYYALYLFPYRTKERNERGGKKPSTQERCHITPMSPRLHRRIQASIKPRLGL